MPRFFDPNRYNEDWYIELKGEYQKFFDFIIEMCDNAGVWKPNKFDFETKTGFKLNLDSFLKKVNGDKERIIVLENGRWFVPGFIQFQFFNKKTTFEFTSHPLHKNIVRSLESNNIPQALVKGLARAYQALKDKDKDIKEKGGMGEKEFIPPTQTLVGDFREVFKKSNPDYFFDASDNAILLEISTKIAKWKSIPMAEILSPTQRNALKLIWEELVLHCRGDSHLSKYSLAQINKHFSSITQSINNSKNGSKEHKTSISSPGRTFKADRA